MAEASYLQAESFLIYYLSNINHIENSARQNNTDSSRGYDIAHKKELPLWQLKHRRYEFVFA
jgi:hypothetical protein